MVFGAALRYGVPCIVVHVAMEGHWRRDYFGFDFRYLPQRALNSVTQVRLDV